MGQLKDLDHNKVAIRICPNCKRAFYSLGGEDAVCSFCGTPVTERRGGDRFASRVQFLLNMLDRPVPAKVEDYSESGIRLAYAGKPLGINSIIDLDISELALRVRARAVWSRALKGNLSYTGFTFIQQEKERFFAQ